MRRSDRSNVVVAHASRPPPVRTQDGFVRRRNGLAVASLRSRELKMESPCRGVETRRPSLFCAVRLAMPFVRLPDKPHGQTLKLFRIESSRALAGRVVFAFHDREEIGPRMLARIAKRTGLGRNDLLSVTQHSQPISV